MTNLVLSMVNFCQSEAIYNLGFVGTAAVTVRPSDSDYRSSTRVHCSRFFLIHLKDVIEINCYLRDLFSLSPNFQRVLSYKS